LDRGRLGKEHLGAAKKTSVCFIKTKMKNLIYTNEKVALINSLHFSFLLMLMKRLLKKQLKYKI
jgi:hypothetical protein